MVDAGQQRTYEDGELVFAESDAGDVAYLIDEGAVEVFTGHDDQRTVFATLGPGEIVGEMALIDTRPRSASVRAIGTTKLTVISREGLNDRLESVDPMVQLVLHSMLDRFRVAMHRVRSGEEEPAPRRVPEAEALPNSPVNEALRHGVLQQSRMEARLRGAIAEDILELHYQPIVKLPLGKPVGYEALARWPQPDGGMISPGEFIPLAEQTSLILELDAWVIRRACIDFMAQGNRLRGQYVSINLSGRQFAQSTAFELVASTLDATGLPPERLQIELTEGVVMTNPAYAAELLAEFQKLGISIAIDDFGTGYSSLAYLHNFSADVLKLDLSFAREVRKGPSGARIVRGISAMADELGLRVVAEGIEAEAEGRQLYKLGCGWGQGFGFGRPRPLAQVLADTTSA